MNKCGSCKISHPKVEAGGLWYCPNALCRGAGGAWFRRRLDSYKENYDGTHCVDETELRAKGREENKKNKINRKVFR